MAEEGRELLSAPAPASLPPSALPAAGSVKPQGSSSLFSPIPWRESPLGDARSLIPVYTG